MVNIPDVPDTTADNMANDLFEALVAGADFTMPVFDPTSTEYDIPSSVDNPLYAAVTHLSETDLTTRTVGGSGTFDALMATIGAHLQSEFEAGRITSKEYSTSYVALSQSAMASAVQYLLAKEQSYWQAELTKQQAKAAEVAVVQAKLQIETLKAQTIQARMSANTTAAEYALAKMRLATEENNMELIASQKAKVDYETDFVLPQEVLVQQKRVDIGTAEISVSTANVAKINYETQSLLPSQKAKIDKDAAQTDYQTNNLLVSQKLNVDEDTLLKQYQKDYLLPAQVSNTNEQTEAHRAKTLDTRSDGITAIAGSMGAQKALHEQQVTSYQRDAEAKAMKMLLDTWITRKTVDDATTLPNQLDTTALNTMLTEIKTNLGLSAT